jgi:putative heme-binding domain-containing protein
MADGWESHSRNGMGLRFLGWIVKKWILAVTLFSGGTLAAQRPADVAAGQRLFEANCAVCHGVDGTGGSSPVNLTRGEFKHGGSEQELFNTISKGVPGTEMPGSFLNAGEIKQVAGFVQSLASSSAPSVGAGDAARGQALFRGAGGCASCHRVTDGGSHAGGGQLGPNLYGVGDRRTVPSLYAAVERIHRGMAEFHWQVSAVTQSGERVTGVRLNEDTLSVQLRDSENNLVSLIKKDLKELKIERGKPLPEFPTMLSPAQMSDLAAYLATLRR